MLIERIAAPLRQQVIDGLREMIVTGRFTSGERLVERDLCERVGVSRTLIREALRQLEAEGLVTVIPNKGPVVTSLDAHQAREVYDARAILEGFATQEFATKGRSADKAALARKHELMSKAFERKDLRAFFARKSEFYQVLVQGCGNSVVSSLLRSLLTQITILRAATLSDSRRVGEVLKELGDIVAAVQAGDGESARDASILHVKKAQAVAVAMLSKSDKSALPDQ